MGVGERGEGGDGVSLAGLYHNRLNFLFKRLM